MQQWRKGWRQVLSREDQKSKSALKVLEKLRVGGRPRSEL